MFVTAIRCGIVLTLSTVIVHVFVHRNQIHPCRVLLDSKSQMNFVTQELVDKLCLNEQSINISISGVVQSTIQAKIMINVRIKSCFNFSENVLGLCISP